MRPYKIIEADIWVDLDTIQQIHEPEFLDMMGFGGYFIELKWQHAFQDKQSIYRFKQEADFSVNPIEPVKNENGELIDLVRVRDEIFKPFFDAWVSKD